MGRAFRHPDRNLTDLELEALREQTTVVTYLEMTAAPDRALARAPSPLVEVRRAGRPTVSFYRYLYDTVGGPWTWVSRRQLDDAALEAEIRDPAVEVQVLWVDGVPAGYIELDFRQPTNVEVLYFGLIPDFIGQALGRFLLDWGIARAWSRHPRRLWVHTCDLDHPQALGLYQRAGFRPYDRQVEPVLPPVPT